MAKTKKKSKTSSTKKSTTTKKNVASKKTSTKANLNTKDKQHTKAHEVISYSCIKKYYIIENTTTGTQNKKRMWIVIGDGHKWYRKFDTQADAINYFRNLKKYAKMRIQSVKSRSFIKTVYTFLMMEEQGVNVKEIIKANKNVKYTNDDSVDFEDEFSQFDVVDNDYDNFDQAEVDKIIAEKEKDIVVMDTTQEVDDLVILNNEIIAMNKDEDNSNEGFEKTLLINKDEKKVEEEPFNGDLYELSQEYSISNTNINNVVSKNNEPKQKNVEEVFSTNSSTSNNTVMNNNAINNRKIEPNNSLSLSNDEDVIEEKAMTNVTTTKSKTFVYWLVIILIALILAAALGVGIYFAATKQ